MSYCPSSGSKQGWIAPFTWNKMFNNLAPAPPLGTPYAVDNLPVLQLVTTTATRSLEVNATIYNPDYAPPVPGQLGPLYKSGTGLAYLLQQGPYAVQLRNSQGNPLATYPFVANFESEYDAHNGPEQPAVGLLLNDPPPFPPDPTKQVDVSFIVPWDPAAASVVLLFNQEVVDERKLTDHAPVVQITSPAGQETWTAGSQHTLKWTGSDQDGNSLLYSVFYSHDGGGAWSLIAGNLASPDLPLNTNDLAGGSDVRFRVVATDGINTGFDETDEAISVPNKSPVATILSPVNKQAVRPGELLVLQGIGVDFERRHAAGREPVLGKRCPGRAGLRPLPGAERPPNRLAHPQPDRHRQLWLPPYQPGQGFHRIFHLPALPDAVRSKRESHTSKAGKAHSGFSRFFPSAGPAQKPPKQGGLPAQVRTVILFLHLRAGHGLHQAEHRPARLAHVSQPAHAGDLVLGHDDLPAVGEDLLEHLVQVVNVHGVDGAVELVGRPTQATVDPGRPVLAGHDQVILHRAFPTVELPAQDFLVELPAGRRVAGGNFEMYDTHDILSWLIMDIQNRLCI